jgi:phosphatidylglycerophosphate synthase
MNRRSALFLVVNGISLLRLPLGMFFLYSYIDESPLMHCASFAAIALAVVSDFADGALARRFA